MVTEVIAYTPSFFGLGNPNFTSGTQLSSALTGFPQVKKLVSMKERGAIFS